MITREEAKVILRAAYDAGTLVAQQRHTVTAYFDAETGSRCAIGHLFTEREAQLLENSALATTTEDHKFVTRLGGDGAYELAQGLIVKGFLPDDPWFISVQEAHDGWSRNGCAIAFLELIR